MIDRNVVILDLAGLEVELKGGAKKRVSGHYDKKEKTAQSKKNLPGCPLVSHRVIVWGT